MTRNKTHNISILLVALLAQLGLNAPAQAESANEWGRWANEDPAENREFEFRVSQFEQRDQGENFDENSDRRRIGTNKGNLIEQQEQAAGADWIGYALYGCSGCDGTFSLNKLANLEFVPVVGGPITDTAQFRFNPGDRSGSLAITSDVAAFNMSFNSANNQSVEGATNITKIFYFGDVTPLYFVGNDSTSDQTSFSQNTVNASGASPSLGFIRISSANSNSGNAISYFGNGVFGKIMPADQIAALAGIAGNTPYTFNGATYLGSAVTIDVNFNSKSWSGTWSANGGGFSGTAINGFAANGSISGNTLTSASVVGIGSSSDIGYVTGGSVTGKLIGVASDPTIIGKTTVNAIGVSAIVPVNDIFYATKNPLNTD